MRRPRLELPGIPQHLVQRGVNRAATFLDVADRADYLADLRECSACQAVAVHAYVLMSNHVHLLVSAQETGAVSRMMQAIGRRYVRRLNAKYQRSGPLWEGRFRSCLVGTDGYLLACMRYIELNPLRAGMVAVPESYPWSSLRGNLGLADDRLLAPHPVFLALGAEPMTRAQRYRAWLQARIDADELAAIREHSRQERAWGSARFQSMVETALGRAVATRSPGRPRQARMPVCLEAFANQLAASSGNVL